MFLVYDFEVYKHDWLGVFLDLQSHDFTIIQNDPERLETFWHEHSKDVFIGYNNNHYDQYIFKGILMGMNHKKINDQIIYDGLDGWEITNEFRKIPMINYDVFKRGDGGLKSLEGLMGHDIRETEIPFDIDRKLTETEMNSVIKYCIHDVTETAEVFLNRINDFNASMGLMKMMNLKPSAISLTHPRLAAKAVKCVKQSHNDEFEYMKVMPTSIDVGKYTEALTFFETASEITDFLMSEEENYTEDDWKRCFYSLDKEMIIAGIPHTLGWGGIHGASDKPVHIKGRLLHVDVTSYYPSLMIQHNLITRNATTPEKLKEIFDYRVQLKKEGKKAEQLPYKIVLNSLYGVSGDKYSSAYDPRNRNAVCVCGQLMLIDLIDKIENHCKLIQSNTDGLIIQIEDNQDAYNKIVEICNEWEHRNKVGLAFDEISEIWQGDVNNYVFKFADGKLERKGGYVKELSELDYDLPIVNKAIVEYLVNHVPVEETINNCKDLREFQKIFKVTSKYKYAWHNGKYLDEKCHRVFASKDVNDTYLGKVKSIKKPKPDKFANCPDHCFIYNDDVTNKKVLRKLDKKWYIELTKKRLKDKFNINA